MTPIIDTPKVGVFSESEVLDWAHRVLGPLENGLELTTPGSVHQVRRLLTRNGDPVVVKWFYDAPCFFHTLDALSEYAVSLGHSAPKLIDHNESLRAVVMTAVPGEQASDELMLDPTFHFRLGTLLRQLHDSAPHNRSSDVPKEWAATLSAQLETVEDLLGTTTAAEARLLALQLLDLEQITLSPTHGNIDPRHILIDPDWGVHLVGFSHAQYDPWVSDLVTLERDWWTYSPELRDAFYTGYEKPMSSEDELLLRAKNVIDALGHWVELGAKRSTKAELLRARQHLEGALGWTLF